MAGGRKSYKEEIQVVKYMTELAGPTFKFIQAMYDTGDKSDRKWAVEQMVKLYGKAIPQAGDDEQNPIYSKQITGMEIIDGRKDGQDPASGQDPIHNQEPETA